MEFVSLWRGVLCCPLLSGELPGEPPWCSGSSSLAQCPRGPEPSLTLSPADHADRCCPPCLCQSVFRAAGGFWKTQTSPRP